MKNEEIICKVKAKSERSADVAISHDKAADPMTTLQALYNGIAYKAALIYGIAAV